MGIRLDNGASCAYRGRIFAGPRASGKYPYSDDRPSGQMLSGNL